MCPAPPTRRWSRPPDGARWWAKAQASPIGFAVARAPAIKRITVPIKNLPKAFEGYRIAQITDVHIGDTLDLQELSRFVPEAGGAFASGR